MKKFFILILILFFIFSCGYKYKSAKLKTPVKIYISSIENSTREPRLHNFFTEILKDEFIKRKDTYLVTDSEKADLILKGKILNFNYSGISFSVKDRALEFRASMKVEITLIDKNGVLLKTNYFNEYREFRTGISGNRNIDVGINENLRTIIYKKISLLIAEDIFDWMFAGF